MRYRHALLTLLGAVCACDAPPQGKETMQPLAWEKAPAIAPSKQRAGELSEQCRKMSRDQFRLAWKEGSISTAVLAERVVPILGEMNVAG